jgi:DNA-binding NarL/FixJ family response regulator
VKVLVADDNPVVLRGMEVLLGDSGAVSGVLTAPDGEQALVLLAEHPDVDVVCLDVRMPRLDGLGVLDEVAVRTACLMLTHSEEPEVVADALARGARGYLVHGTFEVPELLAALHTCRAGGLVLGRVAAAAVMSGGAPRPPSSSAPAGPPAQGPTDGDRMRDLLTDREAEIVDGVLQGLSNAAIGQRLHLSEKTVKNNLNRVYAKVGLGNRVELVAAWHRRAVAPVSAGRGW